MMMFSLPSRIQSGLRLLALVQDQLRTVYDPASPAADEQGYVSMPNVNVVEEMVNMISASRAYQNNVEVMSTARTLMQRTLQIGQQQ